MFKMTFLFHLLCSWASSKLPATTKRQKINADFCCALAPEDLTWKVLGDLSHHVAVEGRRVGVHHQQELVHGLMKRGYQPPHRTVQVLKLPLPICHLSHHGSQRCSLGQKRSIRHMSGDTGALGKRLPTMAAMAADTDPPPGAAVRAPTLLTNCCRDRDTRRRSSRGFTMYLHRYTVTTGAQVKRVV